MADVIPDGCRLHTKTGRCARILRRGRTVVTGRFGHFPLRTGQTRRETTTFLQKASSFHAATCSTVSDCSDVPLAVWDHADFEQYALKLCRNAICSLKSLAVLRFYDCDVVIFYSTFICASLSIFWLQVCFLDDWIVVNSFHHGS